MTILRRLWTWLRQPDPPPRPVWRHRRDSDDFAEEWSA